MQIICNLPNYDLKSFIDETIKGRTYAFEPHTDEGVKEFRVIGQDDYENYDLTVCPGRDIEEELVKHHYKIFFPFANYSKKKYTWGVIGKAYHLDDEENKFATLGYLIYVLDNKIHLETVNYYPHITEIYPSVIREDKYDKIEIGLGMLVYAMKFVRPGNGNELMEKFFTIITDGVTY